MIQQRTEFYSSGYHLVLYHITKCGMTSMRRTFEMQRKPLSNIPRDAKILCVLRNPLDRFISGVLTLRKIGLLKMYSMYQVSPEFKRKFMALPYHRLIPMVLNKIEKDGTAFDSHLQAQVCFLGPSNTPQDEFVSARSAAKVDYWVRLEDVNRFCRQVFGIPAVHNNRSSAKDRDQIINIFNSSPPLLEQFHRIYSKDWDLWENIAFWS